VATREGSGDACGVALAALLVPAAFRRCPLCGADAVAAVTHTVNGRRGRCVVRCGGCATWRALEGRRRRVAALERRMQAIVRRDCRRMALAFCRTTNEQPLLAEALRVSR
jgi:hypothetical protein